MADIDECEESPEVCQRECENIPGSFRCACPLGYYAHENDTDCVGSEVLLCPVFD